ncbi:hypothetical protein DFQ29_009579 [Apophysomyces sp. BC1021]|nr:hypothetical protein DFQ29_009579 [Apophysomyces sp. BC1021]
MPQAFQHKKRKKVKKREQNKMSIPTNDRLACEDSTESMDLAKLLAENTDKPIVFGETTRCYESGKELVVELLQQCKDSGGCPQLSKGSQKFSRCLTKFLSNATAKKRPSIWYTNFKRT